MKTWGQRNCMACGEPFERLAKNQRYCRPKCPGPMRHLESELKPVTPRPRPNEEVAPSRCPRCSSRMLQEKRLMNTFEEYQLLGWQCVACGVTMERDPLGNILLGPVRRVVLAPGELGLLREESSRRTDPKRAKAR
jgi:Zn ribbon nucleic-acid-binding protein